VEKLLNDELLAARQGFDAACLALRPDLHRFCSRMLGDACEGEDVLQDALMLAFYRLPELRETNSLRSWLFRIAHNQCIDRLRARRRFEPYSDETERDEKVAMDDALEQKQRVERALARIAEELPPKERAAVVLKDVLECSLEETVEITESNLGAVKAALSRARTKLAAAEAKPQRRTLAIEPRRRVLIERYLAAFNQRDWASVRALLAEDARLEVVNASEGPFGDRYFTNYSQLAWRWKLEIAWVDGVESVVHFREVDGVWRPHAVVQLTWVADRVALVRDYVHVSYLLRASEVTPKR
jgi:RNA polymerase sigma-70 factor (ECF subfamily)